MSTITEQHIGSGAEARRVALRREREAIERRQYVDVIRLADIRTELDALPDETACRDA